jgi:hypothetical protein
MGIIGADTQVSKIDMAAATGIYNTVILAYECGVIVVAERIDITKIGPTGRITPRPRPRTTRKTTAAASCDK